ncbi:ATP-binding cassette subfamily C protein CydC [Agrobacterium vitis]|nr:ATP-binding cassette subfamily C protein CydC [Agrobacterium vitis]
MMRLFRLFLRIWRAHLGAFLLGTVLSVLVLSAGTALLGLSGWFITATGMAGLMGIGIAFNVFGPSAGIRALALGRAATRYGERVLSHDATLKGLATLRGQLLAAMTKAPLRVLAALRGSERLNHLTLDVDALDGLALRLIIPLATTLVVLTGFIALVWWLESGLVASLQAMSYLLGLTLAIVLVLKTTSQPSRLAQKALQALRERYIDVVRARPELMVSGTLASRSRKVLEAQDRLQNAQGKIDRFERLAGLCLSGAGTVAASASLYLGITLAQRGVIDAPMAAFGFFTALALTEVIAPVHRGLTELGRMKDAARRIDAQIQHGETLPTQAAKPAWMGEADHPVLALSGVCYSQFGRAILKDFSLTVRAGETVALIGPSGVGKSTVLLLALGQLMPQAGQIDLAGHDVFALSEAQLFSLTTLLPQRSALMSGTVMDALRLSRPDLDETQAWDVLKAVQLAPVIVDRGGLDSRLGEGGSGLSGGEQRRLSLARVLLRNPRLLLLDEPTEGLDHATAQAVLAGIRQFLPDAAILMASHQSVEKAAADRTVLLK